MFLTLRHIHSTRSCESCDPLLCVTDVYGLFVAIRAEHLYSPAAEILQEQKWIIAVLFMVPVYASESVSTSPACSDAQSRQRNAITRSSCHFASIENLS